MKVFGQLRYAQDDSPRHKVQVRALPAEALYVFFNPVSSQCSEILCPSIYHGLILRSSDYIDAVQYGF